MRWPLLAAASVALLATPAAAAPPYGERPLSLPAPGARLALDQTWLVGAAPGPRTRSLARRHRAAPLRISSAYRVPAGRARALASALRRAGLLRYAEPDASFARRASFDATPEAWARGAVVPPTLAPPAPTVEIGVVDDLVDTTLADVAHVRLVKGNPSGPHGTMVASAAVGAANGTGVVGIFPSAPLLSYGASPELLCSEVADGVTTLVDAGADVINLSLGGAADCFTLFRAVQRAYAAGALVVAAAGNEFLEGNPISYPAAYPHVLSVAAMRQDLRSAAFSNENTSIDVAAPGESVPVAIPPIHDTDGTVDGMTLAHGTSFAAPIVAGAAAWIASARPGLSQGQVADLLRRTARDLEPAGYDIGTGFGLIDLPAALAAPVPADDPLEPNDGITFVDGTAFGRPDPFVWRGTGRRTIRASVDRVEDPVDVYRIRIPRRAAFRIRLRPSFGDPDLALLDGTSQTLQRGRVIARSERSERRTDSVAAVNDGGRTRSAFVVVDVAASRSGGLAAGYRLEFVRTRRR